MFPANSRLTTLVLGSGAGGGVPQWNCGCRVCRLAWSGDKRVKPRTQAGLALTTDGSNWLLLNASIDLRQQILATPALHPKGAGRHSPIGAVVLTNAEVDSSAVARLFSGPSCSCSLSLAIHGANRSSDP